MNKIILRTETQYSPQNFANYIAQLADQDTIFELIKHLELEIADEDFCKKLAYYFAEEYKKSLQEHYDNPVKFSSTGNYGNIPYDEDDVYTIEEFKEMIDDSIVTDYDGHGHPVKNNMANPNIWIIPSRLGEDIPANATHIVWYNK